MHSKLVSAVTCFALGAVALFGLIQWELNRIYVPDGSSLLLRYKGPLLLGYPRPAKAGQFAEDGETGVLEQMRGPGRHFYCPIWWERQIVPDQVVHTGQVAIVTSKMGEALPSGEFLVNGELTGPKRAKHKGILRKVLGPGRYRANPYAFQFNIIETKTDEYGEQSKVAGWVDIPTGYVGVVTYLSANKDQGRKTGIQDKVLPPGLYPINPREQHVDIVEVGFRETSIEVVKQTKGKDVAHDESGEPLAVPDSGVSFPSSDGFAIHLDFTAIWGVMPEEAPDVIRTFGSIHEAERKVIQPQSESICRNNGSKLSAVEMLVGDSRQQFQIETSKAFQNVLKEKNLTLLYGLVRHIYIPQEIRIPIQNGYIADELKLTREQEKITATTEADLEEAKKKVELEAARTSVETDKLVANAIAEGERQAREIDAETARKVAEIEKQVALLDAQKNILIGEAEAETQRLQEVAKAEKFELAVAAFGSADAYNKWQFAEGLPDDLELKLFYAGEGTLWTDLKSIMPTLPLREAPGQSSGQPSATSSR
jgi:regulator of protease activity HflC (stomatin/prohibitin superfamily)